MKGLSKVYRKVFTPTFYDCSNGCKYERQECNNMVYNAIIEGKPFMLTRYGSIEMIVTNTIRIRDEKRCYLAKLWDYITDKTDLPWMDELVPLSINRNAGVFNPHTENEIMSYFKNNPNETVYTLDRFDDTDMTVLETEEFD